MRLSTLDQVDGVAPGLSAEQKSEFFDSYTRAIAAFQVAGFADEEAHSRAVSVASSRLDGEAELIIDGEPRVPDPADPCLRIDSVDDVRVVRHDEAVGTLTLDVPVLKLTALPYLDASGKTVYEAKLPADFTTPRFLGGIPGKPVTQRHPSKFFNKVPGHPYLLAMTEDESSSRTYGVHHKGQDSVWVEDDKVWARVTLFEPGLVQDVLLGSMREVSTGIVARVVDEEGEINGVRYTRRQVEPLYDHLAFVPRGRCGPECAVKLDGAIQVDESVREGGKAMPENEEKKAPEKTNDEAPRLLHIGDAQGAPTIALCPKVTVEDAAAFQEKIDAEIAARVAAEAKVTELTKQNDSLKGANDGADARIKALETEVKTLKTVDDSADSRFDDRLEVVSWMHENVEGYDHRGKSIAQMRKDALTALAPETKLDGKSDEYIAARFDALQEQLASPVGKNDLRGRKDSQDEGEAPAPRKNLWRDPNKKGKSA